ncbi:MAG: sulfite exporter TauE/SafE family protein, partial [Nitrospirae bacterium]|nr:sulfite exporter TauE/SafE family protein [Nitrospirota bacterium]
MDFGFDIQIALIGLLVGTLIGLTGMGGGALMTPILILFLGVKPTLAVGTDLIYAAATKIFGGGVHFRQKTVEPKIVLYLALGSIPSTLLSVQVVVWIKTHYGSMVDAFVMKALGVTLILLAVMLFLKTVLVRKIKAHHPLTVGHGRKWFTMAAGAIVGFFVGLTSVGSGTLIVVVLLFLFPALPANRIVGTDVVHGALLLSVAGLAHWHGGNVEW